MEPDAKIKNNKKDAPSNIIRIDEFLESGDQCCSKNCICRFYEFQQKELYHFGEDLDGCSQEAKEVALLMNLREHFCNPKTVCRGGERIRQRVAYSVFPFGPMCRSAYLLLWNIGVTRLKNCLSYMTNQNNTIRPRLHGRSGSVSPTALSTDLRQQVVEFVLELAKNIGEASKGRQGRRNLHTAKDEIVYFLPASWSVARLCRQFLEKYSCENPYGKATPLSFSSFRTIFYSDPCKHIRIRGPRSDVCDECALYRRFYRRQPEYTSPETVKIDEEKVKKWQEHMQLAKKARMVYNNDIKRAREMLQELKSGELEPDAYVAHYTSDFMQNLAIPNFADMTKNMYFFFSSKHLCIQYSR